MAKENFRLGQRVVYTDAQGKQKAAQVIGTNASVKSGTDVGQPDEGRAHLLVTPPNGKSYVRENITYGDGTRQFTRV
jgi:hypothetical protein